MFQTYYNHLVVLAGVTLLGLTAGVVGCFAVLRKRSLLGDAIGHATLPGLCLGFLIAGHRSMPALLFGGLVTGLGSLLVFAGINRFSRLREDVGIGIVLSVFYAAGVVGLSLLSRQENAGQAGLETFLFGSTSGMVFEDVVWIAGLAVVSLGLTALLFKELEMVAFDAEFARVQGWPIAFLDIVLMLLIALAVVLGLPAVGALLISALIVTPAAAARFWTNRLEVMLVLAGAIGALAGVVGVALAPVLAWFNVPLPSLPTGPVIIVAAAIVFAGSVAFGSARGLVGRSLRPSEKAETGDV